MKNAGSNSGQCTSSFPCTVLLRKEAALQGLTGVKVWDCGSACYDKQFLASGGQDVEDQYVDVTFLPVLSKADQKTNKMVANFVKYTGADNAASFGAYTWAAGIAFPDAVNAMVKADGINGITRTTILAALDKIHTFDAEGMIGAIDLAGRKITACDVTLQVKNGTFVRVNPTKPGTTPARPRT
jgi:Periplasmic binding protein